MRVGIGSLNLTKSAALKIHVSRRRFVRDVGGILGIWRGNVEGMDRATRGSRKGASMVLKTVVAGVLFPVEKLTEADVMLA